MGWRNGEKEFLPFDAEMKRRQDDVRGWMAQHNVNAALFTSCHCITYYSGRKYGIVVTDRAATTIGTASTAASPGGAAPSRAAVIALTLIATLMAVALLAARFACRRRK